MGIMSLGRLSHESRAFFVTHLVGALSACSHQKSPESSSLASMRRQVEDALSVILPFFIQVAPSDAQACGSCETLLQTCQQAGWTIARLVDEQQSPELKRVADLSRVCLQALLFCPLQTLPFFGH
ncbi:hypothetical protein EDB85DRAFT_2029127 [Lactarius pseudohatsudake]|nr:hypothetical protein EDB85DRAFT_2029127 [Lactarius pseudohatsudake]